MSWQRKDAVNATFSAVARCSSTGISSSELSDSSVSDDVLESDGSRSVIDARRVACWMWHVLSGGNDCHSLALIRPVASGSFDFGIFPLSTSDCGPAVGFGVDGPSFPLLLSLVWAAVTVVSGPFGSGCGWTAPAFFGGQAARANFLLGC